MRTKWYKASWVCTNCDSLTEQTSYEHTFADWSPTCNCIESNEFQIMLSVDDATIQPTHNLTKGNKMEQWGATVSDALPESYNPNALTTYKSIKDGVVTYPAIKTVDLEYKLDSLVYNTRQVNTYANQVSTLKDYLCDNYEELVAEDIAEIFGISLTKTATYNVTITAEISAEVPFTEVDSIEDFISSNITVSSYASEIDVMDFQVDSCDESY